MRKAISSPRSGSGLVSRAGVEPAGRTRPGRTRPGRALEVDRRDEERVPLDCGPGIAMWAADVNQRLEEYRTLLEVGVELAGSLELQRVLELALERAEQICRAETSSI